MDSTPTLNPSNIAAALARGPIGATILYPQDRYPYLVVKASPAGRVLTVRRVQCISIETGHKPARYEGNWPVWSHIYTDQELTDLAYDSEFEIHWSAKRGVYTLGGASFYVGQARYYRDYSY